jgi:hypothetical protein
MVEPELPATRKVQLTTGQLHCARRGTTVGRGPMADVGLGAQDQLRSQPKIEFTAVEANLLAPAGARPEIGLMHLLTYFSRRA